MINVDDVTKEIIKELNPDLPQIPVNPYKMLITERLWIWKNIHYSF